MGLKIITARASSGLLLMKILSGLFWPLGLKGHGAEDRHSQALQRPAHRDDPWLSFLALGAEGKGAEDRHSQGLQRPAPCDDPWQPFWALVAEGASG